MTRSIQIRDLVLGFFHRAPSSPKNPRGLSWAVRIGAASAVVIVLAACGDREISICTPLEPGQPGNVVDTVTVSGGNTPVFTWSGTGARRIGVVRGGLFVEDDNDESTDELAELWSVACDDGAIDCFPSAVTFGEAYEGATTLVEAQPLAPGNYIVEVTAPIDGDPYCNDFASADFTIE